MKRILSMLLIAVLALTAVPALAANDAGTNYTLWWCCRISPTVTSPPLRVLWM